MSTCYMRKGGHCGAQIAPKMLMCARHWKMVPIAIQQKVWAAFRNLKNNPRAAVAAWDEAHAAVLSRQAGS